MPVTKRISSFFVDGRSVPMADFASWASSVELAAVLSDTSADSFATAPPGAPVLGSIHIVAPGATGLWAGQDNKIAWYATSLTGASWSFISPEQGWTISVGILAYEYTGAAWIVRPAAVTEDAYTALVAIGSGKFVYASSALGVSVATVLTLPLSRLILGIATNTASAGGAIGVKLSGSYTDATWAWTPQAPLYIANNGVMSHTPHPIFVRQVAVATSSTSVKIELQPLIVAL